jgi:hypothetical protein
MTNSTARKIFYALFGTIAALLGWSVSYFLIDLITLLFKEFPVPAYVVILTIVTPCIAVATVINEIFLSNPTRPKINWRILWRGGLLKVICLFGVLLGLGLSGLNWVILEKSSLFKDVIWLVSWISIGTFAGFAESLGWRFRSIEGTGDRIRQRMIQSTSLGAIAGLIAAILFWVVRLGLNSYAEPIGFLLLGACLGLALCFASRPSYQVALRAGQGFETPPPKTRNQGRNRKKVDQDIETADGNSEKTTAPSKPRPVLKNRSLQLIPDKKPNYIQEGLSIQIPSKLKEPLVIGSGDNVDIYIPDLPEECASIESKNGEIFINCLTDGTVKVQQRLVHEGRSAPLKHNQVITLYHDDDDEKFYCFVFYDRFLDPQA